MWALPSARIVADAFILLRLLGPSNSLRRNWAALFVAVPWLLFASIRVFSLDRAFPMVSIVSFSPQILVAVVIPLAVALLLRARFVAIGVIVVAVVMAIQILPRSLSQDQPEARGEVVTLMTANLLAGSSATDGIERIVAENEVDVLALQEIDSEAFAILKERGLTEQLPHVVDVVREGVAGSVLMSRWPLRERRVERNPLYFPWPEAIVPRARLVVQSVHPFPPTRPKKTEIWQRDLQSLPAARPTPGNNLRVLMGDFNATLDHREFRALVAKDYRDAGRTTGNGLVPTWSANRVMKLTIDHVLVDSRIAVLSYKTYNLPRSDHDAVVVKVRLPD